VDGQEAGRTTGRASDRGFVHDDSPRPTEWKDSDRSGDAIVRLCQAHRILADQGHGDGTLGHVSLRDPAGRGFWLKRAEIGMDEVMDEVDLLLVSFEGQVLAGDGALHSEWPIHAEPLRADPTITSVVHTHGRHAALLSAADRSVTPLTSEGAYFSARPVPIHRAPRAHIDTPELARSMLVDMGRSTALLLRNHGLVARGSIASATLTALLLERAAAVELQALAAGIPFEAARASEVAGRAAMLADAGFVTQNFAYFARRCGSPLLTTRPS
jgi:L-fuculose-phosphate aldolase